MMCIFLSTSTHLKNRGGGGGGGGGVSGPDNVILLSQGGREGVKKCKNDYVICERPLNN